MMNRFKLKQKIIIGGLLPLVFLMVINVVGLINFNSLLDSFKWVNHTHLVMQDAILIQKIAVDMETGERGFLLSGKEKFLEPYSRWAEKFDKVMQRVENKVKDNPNQVALLQQAHAALDTWKREIGDKYIAKRIELDKTKTKGRLDIVSEFVSSESGKIQMDNFRKLMERFVDNEKALLESRKEVAQTMTADTNRTIIGGTLAAIILAILISIFLIKTIIQPVNNLKETSKKISQGDLDVDINVNSNDELGELANSFRDMITYFKDISHIAHTIGEGNLDVEIKQRSEKDGLGKALQNMATNLQKVMSELSESTSVLNSAASEILATTSQLASSVTQTSAAVSETTSSVEEIKQTAKLTSEKAVHTAESTKKAVVISDDGNKSLDLNMSGLAQIKEKMDLIAANIIKLSEQSQMIGNIVSTVEDIASQSNLLAVNASIEAVKAGEHGKGFSVVAQELKNLANQSKQGTSEVQKILTDIQQATNTLVMVAEQGGKAVDEGVSQAKTAKKSMESLRQSVSEAAQSGTLIAVSSQQEMAGMDQISTAMLGIKDATSQNVESIKQVESSAKNLTMLSQKLKVLMEQYSFGK